MSKTHGKAPRSSRAWSGPWSTSELHEFERFTKQQYYGGAATAPKHIYNTQVISYGSLFTVFVIMFISSIIMFFEDIRGKNPALHPVAERRFAGDPRHPLS